MNNKDIEMVTRIAKLAKLEYCEDEFPSLADEMIDMIKFAALSDESGKFKNTNEIQTNRLREDIAHSGLSRDKLLKEAKETDGEFFVVPRVVEGGQDA